VHERLARPNPNDKAGDRWVGPDAPSRDYVRDATNLCPIGISQDDSGQSRDGDQAVHDSTPRQQPRAATRALKRVAR